MAAEVASSSKMAAKERKLNRRHSFASMRGPSSNSPTETQSPPQKAPLATPDQTGKKDKKLKKRKLSFQGLKNVSNNFMSMFDTKSLQRHMSMDSIQQTQNEVDMRLNRADKPRVSRPLSTIELRGNYGPKLDTVAERRESNLMDLADFNPNFDADDSDSEMSACTSPVTKTPNYKSGAYICHSGSCSGVNALESIRADIGKPPKSHKTARSKSTTARPVLTNRTRTLSGSNDSAGNSFDSGTMENPMEYSTPALKIIPSTPKVSHRDVMEGNDHVMNMHYQPALYASQSCVDIRRKDSGESEEGIPMGFPDDINSNSGAMRKSSDPIVTSTGGARRQRRHGNVRRPFSMIEGVTGSIVSEVEEVKEVKKNYSSFTMRNIRT